MCGATRQARIGGSLPACPRASSRRKFQRGFTNCWHYRKTAPTAPSSALRKASSVPPSHFQVIQQDLLSACRRPGSQILLAG